MAKWGLREDDVHDVLNLFQVTGLDDKGRYFMSPCPAEKGDSIEFLAEQDVLMALSMFLIYSTFQCYDSINMDPKSFGKQTSLAN